MPTFTEDMRILIVHNYYQHRGGEDVVFEQETELLSLHNEVETVHLNNRKGIKGLVQYLLYPWNIVASRKIRKHINLFKPDIVHIHNTHYATGPLIFRDLFKLKIPVVQTLHNFRILDPSASLFYKDNIYTEAIEKDFPWKSVFLRVLDNSFLKTFLTAFTYWLHKKLNTWNQVNTYLVLSNFAQDLILSSSAGISKEQLRIKPNFVHPATNISRHRENYFVYIGRLSSEKGISTMLKAFARSDHKLKIYGDGPLADEVFKYAGKHTNIEYFGYQEKNTIQLTLSKSQALILPSICYEGMPMTVLDAFAHGIPVIASRLGVLNDMIQNNRNGLLFEPNNELSLLKALKTWENILPNEKLEMSENCKKEYLEKYTPEKNVLLLESIYKDTIKQNNEYHRIRQTGPSAKD